jgi:cytochrome P450
VTLAEPPLPRPLVHQAQVDQATDEARRARFPAGAALTFADMEQAGHEPALDALREAEPVSWVPAIGGWLVTSRQAAREVLTSPVATVEAQENLVRASLGAMMLTSDGDEHARLRKPFEPPFKVSTVEQAFAEVIRGEATALLDGLAAAGSGEIGEQFAAPFAVRMAGRLLGISLEDTRQINEFYSAFAAAMVYDGNPEPQRLAARARQDLNQILHRELGRSRLEGGRSVTSLVAGPDAGITDDEIVAQLRVIMFGAIETIQASIMNTLLLLLQHPEQLADVRDDPALLTGAGEEARRLIPPVSFAERWTRQPVQAGGVTIPAGEFIGVSILAANRDPETFEDPARFDIRRKNSSRGLTFSFGPHACLGLHVARLETRIALEEILARLPGLRLAGHEPPSGFAFRRPAVLHLAWDN